MSDLLAPARRYLQAHDKASNAETALAAAILARDQAKADALIAMTGLLDVASQSTHPSPHLLSFGHRIVQINDGSVAILEAIDGGAVYPDNDAVPQSNDAPPVTGDPKPRMDRVREVVQRLAPGIREYK